MRTPTRGTHLRELSQPECIGDLGHVGRLPVDRLMSGMLSIDELNEGFDRLHDGHAIRQVVSL